MTASRQGISVAGQVSWNLLKLGFPLFDSFRRVYDSKWGSK